MAQLSCHNGFRPTQGGGVSEESPRLEDWDVKPIRCHCQTGLSSKDLITADLQPWRRKSRRRGAIKQRSTSSPRYIVFYSQKESVNQLASTPEPGARGRGSISIVCFGEKTIREFYCFRFYYNPIVFGRSCAVVSSCLPACLLPLSMS